LRQLDPRLENRESDVSHEPFVRLFIEIQKRTLAGRAVVDDPFGRPPLAKVASRTLPGEAARSDSVGRQLGGRILRSLSHGRHCVARDLGSGGDDGADGAPASARAADSQ
jgi:hypothetical protein